MASYYQRKNGTYCVRVYVGMKDGKEILKFPKIRTIGKCVGALRGSAVGVCDKVIRRFVIEIQNGPRLLTA